LPRLVCTHRRTVSETTTAEQADEVNAGGDCVAAVLGGHTSELQSPAPATTTTAFSRTVQLTQSNLSNPVIGCHMPNKHVVVIPLINPHA